MVVAIIAGKGGTGKTSQIFSLANIFEPFWWAIMEKKDERMIATQGELLISIGKDYMIDPTATLNGFQSWRDKILEDKNPPLKCIVVDGISDIREYAIEEWIQAHPLYDKDGKEKKRESIGAKNLSGWSEVNKRTRSLLEPLINYGLYRGVHVFFTAQMKQVYANNIRTGEQPDIKEWQEYPCECIIQLHKDKGTDHYWCSCEKAPAWSKGTFKVDLCKDTGLLEVMSMQGLLEEG